MEHLIQIGREVVRILNESSFYLLLGFTLAGLLHVLMQRYPGATASLTGGGSRPVFLASLIGLPMPLCSCGVLPAALALRRNGASKGATASFLISVPETDVVSILLTLALMGPLMGVFRPVAALVTAIFAGLIVNYIDARSRRPAPVKAHVVPGGDCCRQEDTELTGSCEDAGVESGSSRVGGRSAPRKQSWLVRAFHFGFVEIFDDVILQLLIGFVLAGAIVTWLPGLDVENLVGDSPLLYPVMLAIGVPVYVCATASTPLAAGLIAGGISPGAAMVFLLAGPATNIAGLLVLNKHFGARVLGAYLLSIAVFSMLAGALLDRITGPDFDLPVAASAHANGTPSSFQVVCSVILVALAALAIARSRVLPLLSRRS